MAVQQFPGKMLRDSSVADAKLVELYIKANGTRDFTAAQSMGGFKLTSLASPTTGTDAANKNYVDALVNGLDVKYSVRVATTAAGTLATDFENGDTIDGVVLATGDRILIKDQATASENGIYTVNASGAPTRATDADVDAEVTAGMFTFVSEGTTWADTGWVLTTNDPITLDTTSLTFSQFSSAGVITAGAGMTQTGNTFNVIAGDASLLVNANDMVVQYDAAGALETTGTGVRVRVDDTAGIDIDGSNNIVALIDTNSFAFSGGNIALAAGVAGAGLTLTAGVLAVGAGDGITVNANDVALASTTAGAGLTYTAGVLDVVGGNGITANANNIELDVNTTTFAFSGTTLNLASTVAGDALVLTAGVLDVQVDTNSFAIVSDAIALASGVAGAGLTLTAGVLDVGAGDGITVNANDVALASTVAGAGLTYTAGVLDVVAGNTSVVVSANSLVSAVPTVDDKDIASAATTGDAQDTGVDITNTPAAGSYVQVFINGKLMSLGDGVLTKACYFSDDGGTTAQAYADIVATDSLYFNGVVAGFDLTTSDYIDLCYCVA